MQPNNMPGAWQQPPVNPGQVPPQNQAPQMQPKKHMNRLLIPLIITVLLFFSALGFGVWAYMERQTYKTETDAIVAREVEIARQETATAKDAEFIEKEKEPFKQYKTPAVYGAVTITYPKTWSAFVEEDDGSTPINGYFHPDFVPAVKSGTAFALRVEVLDRTYDSEMDKLESKVKRGQVTVKPFRAKKVPNVLGAKITGEINKDQKNTMVMFPLRDKTLKISTESESFFKDFNEKILPELTFTP